SPGRSSRDDREICGAAQEGSELLDLVGQSLSNPRAQLGEQLDFDSNAPLAQLVRPDARGPPVDEHYRPDAALRPVHPWDPLGGNDCFARTRAYDVRVEGRQ